MILRELDLLDKELIAKAAAKIVGCGSVKIDEPMREHTSFKVGGPADILVLPSNIEQVADIIKLCKAEGIKPFIMGNGTNLIVREKGIRGIVIKIYDKMNRCYVKGDIIEAEAGILLSKLTKTALDNGLSGLEFAGGIPGTLGGAVAMNAGAYGGEMKDVVIYTEYVDSEGELRELKGEQHEFGYRSSIIQKNGGVVVKSVLKMQKRDKAAIKALMDELSKRRKENQPLEFPSAGSIFKRPQGYYTGKLIQDCGLKGYRIGGAEVSAKHCGFIVNTGKASADDVIALINYIQKKVKESYGVDLETEVKIVGEE